MTVHGEAGSPVQAGFSVPKRSFPRAADRNRIKRLMREAWRLRKGDIYEFLDKKKLKLAAMMIFTGRKKPEYGDVSERVAVIIQQVKKNA